MLRVVNAINFKPGKKSNIKLIVINIYKNKKGI